MNFIFFFHTNCWILSNHKHKQTKQLSFKLLPSEEFLLINVEKWEEHKECRSIMVLGKIYQWMIKLLGENLRNGRDFHSFNLLTLLYLLITKAKLLTLWWRNLADFTLTKWSNSILVVMRYINLKYLLIGTLESWITYDNSTKWLISLFKRINFMNGKEREELSQTGHKWENLKIKCM